MPPDVEFAVKGAEATPDAFVEIVINRMLLLKKPDPPETGAVNVTFTPETGLLPASRTVTPRGFKNAALIVAFCGVVPALAVIEAAAPPVFVRRKLTAGSPFAEAATL